MSEYENLKKKTKLEHQIQEKKYQLRFAKANC